MHPNNLYGAKCCLFIVGFPSLLLRATSHMRLRARDHSLQAHSLVEKAEPVQVRFTLRLRNKEYANVRWMYILHGFLNGIKWIMFHGYLDYFQNPPLRPWPNTKSGDHGTLNAHNR